MSSLDLVRALRQALSMLRDAPDDRDAVRVAHGLVTDLQRGLVARAPAGEARGGLDSPADDAALVAPFELGMSVVA
jgi:hypothetical protein